MRAYLWEFDVEPAHAAEFERVYGPQGDWSKLFRLSAGYLSTELWRDVEVAGRYWTLDRWRSAAELDAFRREHAAAYAELDARCARLTRNERRITEMDLVETGGAVR